MFLRFVGVFSFSAIGMACCWADPNPPLSVAPSSNVVDVARSVTLQVNASSSDNLPVTVRFYGRPVAPGSNFTLVTFPDTQYYTAGSRGGSPAMFTGQADWVINNRVSKNIAYVAGLGDIVDHGDTNAGPSNLGEWLNATNAYYRLENPATTQLPFGIPYGAAVGNHDQSPNGEPSGTSSFYNQFFGVSHFAGRPYYGGHYGTNNDNHFDFFSAGGMDFIAVFLEYDPDANTAILNWANQVLQTNSHRRAIIVSHYIGTPGVPCDFGDQGQALYTALRTNANVFLMLSGHVNGEGMRQDFFNGRTIHTLVSDYQFRTNGGSAWLRLMEFCPSNGVIHVSTYTPWFDQFEVDADSKFDLPYAMQPPSGDYTPLGTNVLVPSGTVTSFTWNGLLPAAAYEWFATVSEGSLTATGSVWRFNTSLNNSNSLPTISAFPHQIIYANGATTNIPFTVKDAESAASNLLVAAYAVNGNLIDESGIAITGNGTNRFVKLTPKSEQAGASWISVVVSDGIGWATNSFMLKVLRPHTITLWNFNSVPPDGNTSTGTLQPAVGSGTATSVGTCTNSLNSNVAPVSFDPATSDNAKWRIANFPAQGTGNKTSGAEFHVNTVGYQNLALSWDHYNSATGSRYWRVQYSLDGTHFADYLVYTNPVDVTWFPTGVSFAGIPGVANNPNFAFRFVSEFQSTATGQGVAQYKGTQGSGGYSTVGTLWLDMVTLSGDAIVPALAFQKNDSAIILSWPAGPVNFTLQTSSTLSPAGWTAYSSAPVLTAGQYSVTITNLSGTHYFRLSD